MECVKWFWELRMPKPLPLTTLAEGTVEGTETDPSHKRDSWGKEKARLSGPFQKIAG